MFFFVSFFVIFYFFSFFFNFLLLFKINNIIEWAFLLFVCKIFIQFWLNFYIFFFIFHNNIMYMRKAVFKMKTFHHHSSSLSFVNIITCFPNKKRVNITHKFLHQFTLCVEKFWICLQSVLSVKVSHSNLPHSLITYLNQWLNNRISISIQLILSYLLNIQFCTFNI